MKNLAIQALAGSGKTEMLGRRFIALLIREKLNTGNSNPQKIIALTFTRKAAGEFFDRIIGLLARAIEDEELRNALIKLIEEKGDFNSVNAHFIKEIICELIENLDLLSLQTIDSFFYSLIQSFSLEMGLPSDVTLMEKADSNALNRSLMMRCIDKIDEGERNRFIQILKKATWGKTEKRIVDLLGDWIKSYHRLFQEVKDPDKWGNPNSFWEGDCPYTDVSIESAQNAWEKLSLNLLAIEDKRLTKWVIKVGFSLDGYWDNNIINSDLESLIEKGIHWIQNGLIKYYKTFELEEDQINNLSVVVSYLIGAELKWRSESVKGIFDVLNLFDGAYQKNIEQSGQLDFSDLPVLLSGISDISRSILEFRMDAKYSHWLLDEFQDTSRWQWKTLHSLIAEVVQDDSNDKSFFYVGDTKQSIYSWRGGDPTLFQDVAEHFGYAIEVDKETLSSSWRSDKPILNLVNQVFDPASITQVLGGSSETIRWAESWQHHDFQPSKNPGLGFSQVVELCGDENRMQLVADQIKEIAPHKKGLTCAVLVQKNDVALKYLTFLRSQGISSYIEGEVNPIMDNTVCLTVLSLFDYLANPSNTKARGIIEMSPMVDSESIDTLGEEILEIIQFNGYGDAVQHCGLLAKKSLLPDDVFLLSRLDKFIELAKQYDRSANQDLNSFCSWLRDIRLRQSSRSGSIQIMTVHKSKGLGFDLVFLPDLTQKIGRSVDSTIRSARKGFKHYRNRNGDIDWVFDFPTSKIAESEPVLSQYLDSLKADQSYEEICKLYVAFTRAKKALYVYVDKPGKNCGKMQLICNTFGDTVERQFESNGNQCDVRWENGDLCWYDQIETSKLQKNPEASSVEFSIKSKPNKTDSSHQPSQTTIFEEKDSEAMMFGDLMHKCLEAIKFVDDNTTNILSNHSPLVADSVQRILNSELGKIAFSKSENCIVKREQSIDFIDSKGRHITGIIDRLNIYYNTNGEIEKTWIIDFKSSSEDPNQLELKYADQLSLYAEGVSQVFNIPMDKIKTSVIGVS